jgi:glucose-1-phosphate adenylyltransferase
MRNVLAMVLAGGKGERLHPLTLHRAKPAVPFGGKYRIIDFTLSNCINSGLRRVAVLVQYKSLSLMRHLKLAWDVFNSELGEFVIAVPPQQRVGKEWYQGTADAIYQNVYMIEKELPDYLLVLAGDHLYKMDYGEMYRFHLDRKTDATIAAIEIELEKARAFGVLEVDAEGRVVGFEEKPRHPKPLPGRPDRAFVSMGVYLFNRRELVDRLKDDALRDTAHDFGRDILPAMIKEARVYAYDFKDKNKGVAQYWRDIGTLDAYWEANMDLASVEPLFDLYDRDWPIRTYHGQYPPAKFVFAQEYPGGRLGIALDSIVCEGCIVSGGRVQDSVLSPGVRINSYAEVRESVLMENVVVGRHCRIRRAIIDKDVTVPPGTIIGYDPEEDARRFHVTPSGIVVIPKGISPKGISINAKGEEPAPIPIPTGSGQVGSEQVESGQGVMGPEGSRLDYLGAAGFR